MRPQGSRPGPAHRSKTGSMLERAYKRLNRKWFQGMLPGVELRWEACGSMGDYGDETIRISPALREWRNGWELTLFHEMIHVYVDEVLEAREGAHGRAWRGERARLYQAGAFLRYV